MTSAQARAGGRGPGRIVVSILEPTLARWRAAAWAATPYADELELRLDGFPDAWLARLGAGEEAARDELRTALRGLGRPVLAALNDASAFGRFAGSETQRAAVLLGAAAAGAVRLDVPASCAAAFRRALGDAPGPPKVVSRHAAEWRAGELADDYADLCALAEPGDRIKLVPALAGAEQGLRLLGEAFELGDPERERSVFGSGPRAGFTRAFAPATGARIVYAAAPGAAGTAPGQLDAATLRAAWPARFDAETRLLAVFGRPAAHSASPRLHAAVRRELGLNAVYAWLEPDALAPALEAAAALPGFRGASVTAPFKRDALRLASSAAPRARRSAAANTLVLGPDGWSADNTDAEAVLALVGACVPAGECVRVVGAGGAARGALAALVEAGLEVEVAARRPAAAAELAAEFGATAVPLDQPHRGARRVAAVVHCTPAGREPEDVVHCTPAGREPEDAVHCTPAGREPEDGAGRWPRGRPAIPPLLPGMTLLDAVYLADPAECTPLVAEARAAGCTVHDGRAWLGAQALGQVRRFHGREVALEVLERALLEQPRGPGHRPHLALVGARAVGKSSVGRALAAAAGLPFVDLDDALFARARAAGIAGGAGGAGELLAALGEAEFRRLEQASGLACLAAERPCVLATGGGAVLSAALREALVERARVVWLQAPPEVLVRRLLGDPLPRPALRGASAADELAELLREREPLYAAVAEQRLDASARPVAALAAELVASLGLLPAAG